MTRYLAFIVALLVVSSASAGLITVGSNVLNPDQAGQKIEIRISGGELILGMVFRGETGLGASGPIFTAIDIEGPGTLFAGETPTKTTLADHSFDYRVSSTGADIYADGVLAILTVSTVGLYSGSYDLSIKDTLPSGLRGTLVFGPSLTINNGTMEVVPEPASMALMAAIMACGAPALLAYRRRRRISATPAC